MRIAFVVSDITLPPREGLHEQLVLLIEQLRLEGHLVDVSGFARTSPLSLAAVQGRLPGPLYRYSGSALLRASEAALPFTRHGREVRAVRRRIEEGRYDLVHAHGPLGALVARGLGRMPAVISWTDPGSHRLARFAGASRSLASRLLLLVGARVYRVAESVLTHPAHLTQLVSEPDAVYWRRVHPARPVAVVPVMVPALAEPVAAATPPAPPFSVLIPCDLRQEYFQDALHDLLRALLRRPALVERVRLHVIGRTAPRAAVRALLNRLDCVFDEWVPDFDEATSASHAVLLLDPLGTGLKNRTVRALAAGVPLVGTSVAFEGIDRTDQVPGTVRDGPDSLLDGIEEMLDSYATFRVAAREAASAARSRYGAPGVMGRWAEAYARAMAVNELATPGGCR